MVKTSNHKVLCPKCKGSGKDAFKKTGVIPDLRSLTDSEINKLEEFQLKHKNCKVVAVVETNSSGIGTQIIVKCSKCKQSTDITDYDCW